MGTLNLASLGSPNCHRSLVQSVTGAQLFPWPFYKQLVHRNLLNTSFFLHYVIWLVVICLQLFYSRLRSKGFQKHPVHSELSL